MKKTILSSGFCLLVFLFCSMNIMAQSSNTADQTTTKQEMKMYVIERNISGAGQFDQDKLKSISKTSCSVLSDMGPSIQWVESYVTADKIFCIYKAENIELVKEHAKRGGFPANNIYEVSTVISPKTATAH